MTVEGLPMYEPIRDAMPYRGPCFACGGPDADRFRAYVAPGLESLATAKALACWCPLDQPCHGDVLADMVVEMLA